MHFFSIEKKPNLYAIGVLTGIVAVISLIMYRSGASTFAVSVLFDLYFIAVLLYLLWAWFNQIRYNPYSYNVMYYFGFALYVLSIVTTMTFLTFHQIFQPGIYTSGMIIRSILQSARHYILLSLPFLAVCSIALCISNVVLIRKEGKRLVNVLGILLSIVILAGNLFLYHFDFFVTGRLNDVLMKEMLTNLFAAVYLYFECMLVGATAAMLITALHEPEYNKDFLIVLGCGVKADGTPTSLLAGRLDRALEFYEAQKRKSERTITFITSGGQGPDEKMPESSTMKLYLMDKGIPNWEILEEYQSTDTLENMRYSKGIIDLVDPRGNVSFSTTNYHVFRSGGYARKVGMKAEGMGAMTKWYFWPNAAVREFIGLLRDRKLRQAVILISLMALYAFLTWILYR